MPSAFNISADFLPIPGTLVTDAVAGVARNWRNADALIFDFEGSYILRYHSLCLYIKLILWYYLTLHYDGVIVLDHVLGYRCKTKVRNKVYFLL